MNAHIDFLLSRSSSTRLADPAPNEEELDNIFKAALRAPDHAGLKPARFINIAKHRLEDFGEVFETSLIKRDSQATLSQRERARAAPLRAPMIVVVVAKITSHAKVPPMEQRLSVACSAYAILLAAESCGYAGIWRTGDAARDPNIERALDLCPNEEVIGFLYLGTRVGQPKKLDEIRTGVYVTHW